MTRPIALSGTAVLVLAVACNKPPPHVPAAAPPAAAAPSAAAPAPPQPTLAIKNVPDAAAALDPEHDLWTGAPPLTVPLQPQVLTTPKQTIISVTSVDVQAVADARLVAFRLRWRDMTRDHSYEQDLFPDACALMLPVDANASFMMGNQGARVHVLHWKALWQRDVDEGFQDVQDLHPNYWADTYWFAKGGWPHPVPAAFADPRSHAWFPARAAGNPMSSWDRRQPVQELLAEGFGTLTVHERATARGRGVWRNGTWTVVVARDLDTDDPLDYSFAKGQPLVGFAVWDGTADNVGSRKHYSMWTPFARERP